MIPHELRAVSYHHTPRTAKGACSQASPVTVNSILKGALSGYSNYPGGQILDYKNTNECQGQHYYIVHKNGLLYRLARFFNENVTNWTFLWT